MRNTSIQVKKRHLFAITHLGIGFLASFAVKAYASGEVAADPPVILLGQSVKLRWYFTGTKVMVSGGRFGAGVVVTGKMQVSDTPKKTTTYRFDVDYVVSKTDAAGVTITKPEHQKYSVTALVDTDPPDPLTHFTGGKGWKIDYFSNWKCDISTPDNGQKALFFFQKEFDSVERMAVAIVPANQLSASDVLEKALADTRSHYQNVDVEPELEATIAGVTAATAMFTGDDESHPGVKTSSILFAFVDAGRAYVISARTRASNMLMRRARLERMLRTFVLPHHPATDLRVTR